MHVLGKKLENVYVCNEHFPKDCFEVSYKHEMLGTKTRGTYHTTKFFKIFKTGTNGTEVFCEKFQKIWKLLNFQKANHSTANSGNFGMKVKWNGNFQEKISKILVSFTRLSSFLGFMQISNFLLSTS